MLEIAARSTLDHLLESAEHVILTRWFSGAALSIFVYDNIITLDDEIQFIWPKRWSLVKFSIYCNRLLAFGFLILNAIQLGPLQITLSNRFCSGFFPISGWMAYVSFGMCNWIMLARTSALLHRMKLIRNGLKTLYFCAYIATGGLVVLATFELQGRMFRSDMLHACAIRDLPRLMPYIWISPMVFETVMFGTTVVLAVLFRDGVWYYLIIIVLRGINLASWLALPAAYSFSGLFVLWAVMSVSVTRLQINLSKSANADSNTSQYGYTM